MITGRRIGYMVAAVTLIMVSVPHVAAQSGDATGLERAREAAVQSLDRANEFAPGQANRARGLDPERLRGLERAAGARDRAQSQGGNGRGNAFGRRAKLEATGDQSENVRRLVEAHNSLRNAEADD